MKRRLFLGMMCLAWALPALGQEENPEFHIKAQFRDPQQDDESVGNANFLIRSRFGQVYYGGVVRQDEFRFKVELDSHHYAGRTFDFYLEDFFVGGLTADASGFLEQTYRSDFKPDDAPDLPLPVGFPDLVEIGDVVKVFDHATQTLLLSSELLEEFDRGDADHDGDVDDDDFDAWENNYGDAGIGPANGDYSGDNRAGGDDMLIWQRNYNSGEGSGAAAIPEPSGLWLGLLGVSIVSRRKRRRVER